MSNRSRGIPVNDLDVSAFTIPTSSPEADGTLSWNQTTIVVGTAEAGGLRSLGYTYAGISTAQLIDGVLKPIVLRQNSLLTGQIWMAMRRAVRNLGHPGICSMAIAAVDNSLWDLKARLCGTPLFALLGGARSRVAVYGSGGFTSYSILQLEAQLRAWVAEGIRTVKMKVGSRPEEDVSRVCAARKAIGPDIGLMVDANGAYSRKQAVRKAFEFRDLDVTWFEEPVSSDDLEGLRLVRDQGPPGMEIAAGEYGYDLPYFHRMLDAGSVDVLQADATRCGGITGFLQVGALCSAQCLQLSAHCAPALHAQPCCATLPLRHIEYFHDHVRIEQMLFDGAPRPVHGAICPDLSRPGLGLEFKPADAKRFLVWPGGR